jgi:nitroreductase/NAD-dependent dihydropyrimidine dehydrogenase PreA subunit
MTLLDVNESTCTQCGLCAAVCPGSFITVRKNSFPVQAAWIKRGCIRCGHCIAVCPSGSLKHADIPFDQSTLPDKSLDVVFTQAAQLIKGRRSIREYKDEKVSPAEIASIIEVARYAPTAHNNQGVQWLVITDPITIKHLTEIGLDWMRWAVTNNSSWSAMVAGLLKLQESGQDVFLRNAPSVVFTFCRKSNPFAAIDCTSAIAYFDLAAVSAGLGCCWNGLLQMAATSFPGMVEALALPAEYAPYGCLMVGYPRYRYTRLPARQPAAIIYRT